MLHVPFKKESALNLIPEQETFLQDGRHLIDREYRSESMFQEVFVFMKS